MPPTPPASSNENAQNNECRYRPAIKNIKIKKSNTKSVCCVRVLSRLLASGESAFHFFFSSSTVASPLEVVSDFLPVGKSVGERFGRLAKKTTSGDSSLCRDFPVSEKSFSQKILAACLVIFKMKTKMRIIIKGNGT